MNKAERKIRGKYTALVIKAGIENPPELGVHKDVSDPHYNDLTRKIMMPPSYAKQRSLEFILGHELGHHEHLKSSVAKGLMFVSRNLEINSCTTSAIRIGAIFGIAGFLFDKDSASVYIYAFIAASALLQKVLAVATNYISEFRADKFAAQLSSPEEGIELYLRDNRSNKLAIKAAENRHDYLTNRIVDIECKVGNFCSGLINKGMQIDEGLKCGLSKFSNIIEEIEKERAELEAKIKGAKKDRLNDLLEHPPTSWRVLALARMSERNNHDGNNLAKL